MNISNNTKRLVIHLALGTCLGGLALLVSHYTDKQVQDTVKFKTPDTPVPDKIKVIKPNHAVSWFNQNSIDETNIDCLAEAIYYESRGEPLLRYVGDVVLNRVKSRYFPNTICGVVHDDKQFSYTADSNKRIQFHYEVISKSKSYRVAKAMYLDYKNGTYKSATRALYYYNPDLVQKPNWVSSEYYLKTVGNHRFYSWHKNA